MIRIAEIHRYPVKSMLGERLMGATLTGQGIPGDRAWALKDESRGGLTGAKRFPELMGMSARFLSEPTAAQRSPAVRISRPGGETFTSIDDDADARLSRVLGSPVSIWPLQPAENLEHYRREAGPEDTDMTAAMREL